MGKRFGEFISKKRQQNNLSIRKMAQMLSMSSSYLCDLEQGRKLPPQDENSNLYDDLVIVLKLNDEEIQEMKVSVDNDLAERSKTSPDLINYISNNDEARMTFRLIKELNPTDLELKEVVNMLKNKMNKNRPVYRDETIDTIAYNLLLDKYSFYIQQPIPVDIERIIELEGYSLQGVSFADRGILGSAIFKDTNVNVLDSEGTGEIKTITVKANSILFDEFEAEKSEVRYRTTIAHELGHMILHKKYYTNSTIEIKCRKDVVDNYDYKELTTRYDWEEHQANWFAACILIPKDMLIKMIYELVLNFEIPIPSKLKYISSDEKNRIIDKISTTFNVSRQMAKIRFEKVFLR